MVRPSNGRAHSTSTSFGDLVCGMNGGTAKGCGRSVTLSIRRLAKGRGLARHGREGEGPMRFGYTAAAHGRPEEENLEGPSRQASRHARDRGAARQRLPAVRVAEARAPHLPDVRDLQGPRSRAAPPPGSISLRT